MRDSLVLRWPERVHGTWNLEAARAQKSNATSSIQMANGSLLLAPASMGVTVPIEMGVHSRGNQLEVDLHQFCN